MAEYRVVWSVDLDDADDGTYPGDTPEVRVAHYAREVLKRAAGDPDSICWVFDVLPKEMADASGPEQAGWPHHVVAVTVDLDEIEGRV